MGYADDHQVTKSFTCSSQTEVLTIELQNCFETIKRWMNQFFLQLNDSKTQIIVFGSSNVLRSLKINGINLGSNNTIRFVSTVKNLGVYMESSLTFEKQTILLYIKRDDIYIFIYPHHFTDTRASTLTRRSAKTVKDIMLKLFLLGQMP